MSLQRKALVLGLVAATPRSHFPDPGPTGCIGGSGRYRPETGVENLQDVPIAISAFDATTIQRAGIERANDYISLVPNVTIVDTANVGDTQVSIRGIISTRDAESTFAYVVDGVLSTNPNSFNEELFDVQSIEVLKGPQGALYGRNAVAGAILVTTKAPTDEFEASIGGGVGNRDLWKLNAMVSGPIVEEKLLGRFAISTREFDGHYKNIYTNEDDVVDYLDDTSARGRLIWNVNEDLSFDFRAGYSEVEGGAHQLQRGLRPAGLRGADRQPELHAERERHGLQVHLQYAR